MNMFFPVFVSFTDSKSIFIFMSVSLIVLFVPDVLLLQDHLFQRSFSQMKQEHRKNAAQTNIYRL